jgi:hypothetical protein
MRAGWAIVAGLALGIGLAWWLARPSPEARHERRERAEEAAMADARDAQPKLYRWRDAAGVLQVTAEPPPDRPYETVDLAPREGIEVRGDR